MKTGCDACIDGHANGRQRQVHENVGTPAASFGFRVDSFDSCLRVLQNAFQIIFDQPVVRAHSSAVKMSNIVSAFSEAGRGVDE
jgi:hypothetical protein